MNSEDWQKSVSTAKGWLRTLFPHGSPMAQADLAGKLAGLIAPLQVKADQWDKLVALAGHWQDGSCETVKLGWDDATRTASIQVGKHSYYVEGGGFEEALGQAPELAGE